MNISKLSWSKNSFFAKLVLFLVSVRCERKKIASLDLSVKAEGYSSLSSTYYSIVSTAIAKLKKHIHPAHAAMKVFIPLQLFIWICTWLPLAGWCFVRMISFSNKAYKLLDGNMSANQFDIRQSILRVWKKYDEAEACIHSALKIPPEKAHTRCLLHVGLAHIYKVKRRKDLVVLEVNSILSDLDECEKTDVLQSIRVCRHVADLYEYLGDYLRVRVFRKKAFDYSSAAQAGDQWLKI